MSDRYETEVVRKVYDNDHGEAVTISPSPDFPGNVMLYVEEKHQKYFGDARLDLPAEFMRKIAKALLEACSEADSKE
jgi:hypothetical protein